MVKLLVLNLSLDADTQEISELGVMGAHNVANVDVTVSSLFDSSVADELSDYDAIIINVDEADAQESLPMLLNEADNPLSDGCLVGKLATVNIHCSDASHDLESLKDDVWNQLNDHGMIIVPIPGDESNSEYALHQGQHMARMASWLR